ncbi:MAG: hypothetical protein J6V01_06030 [Clostridia bacterium]|nr:hypothetical protein [Clostridia bacterium]
MSEKSIFSEIEKPRRGPTLQEKLAARKYKTPSRFITFLYDHIASAVLLPKYNPHITVDPSAAELHMPCIIVWNHLSRLDHLYTMKAVYPRAYNMVAGYSEFFRSHLRAVFKLNQIIPKKIYEADIPGIRAMSSILKKGGIVTFSPEGMSSIYGTNQPVVPGSGRFIKFFGVHVYFLEMAGQYLTSTKHYLEERKGWTEAKLSLLYTPEQLREATGDEVEAKLNEIFRHDEFEWTRERRIRWKMHGRSCEHLDEICYRCPKCGTDLSMKASGDSIVCSVCGNGARMNDYYEFEPFAPDCVIPVSPSKWVEEERVAMIRAIRSDPGYSFTEEYEVGYLPRYKLLKKKKTSEKCGSGKMTFDHSGIHFSGEIAGRPYSFDLSYEFVYSLVIMTDTSKFALYVDGEFLEFTPKTRSVGKTLLLTEEMHRLHFNVWKNFPWNAWMYE